MSITGDILLGSAMLAVCALLYVAILAFAVGALQRLGDRMAGRGAGLRSLATLGLGFAAVVLAHTLQVWLWAFAVQATGTLAAFEDAFYFSLVTSTTVGYGDLTLGEGWRIFGAFAGVTGLLTFGLSTAVLVIIFERVLRAGE